MSFPRPEPTPPREYQFPAVERETLANGLRIAVAHVPRLPLVTVLALVDAGATCDPSGGEGEAMLCARALAEGTARVDAAMLTEQFELLGTSLHTGSDWDDAAVTVSVMPQRLAGAVALLGEVLISPAFAEGELERLKAERVAEFLQQRVEPRGLADDKFAEFLFADDSRYRLPVGGTPVSIGTLDAPAIRSFHAGAYTPSATTLIFAGDVKAGEAIRLAEGRFSAWRGGSRHAPTVKDGTRVDATCVHVVHKPGAPQTELRVGHRGVPRDHPDYFPIVVMNALLGGLFASRINMNLRERNAYTYGARSAFDWRRGAGPFVVATAVKTEVTAPAINEILGEMRKLQRETIGAAELSLATAYLDGVFPIRFETTEAVAGALATAAVHKLGDDYYDRYRSLVRAVSADDVQRVAETHLHPDAALIVAVGDADVIRTPLEQLGLGSVALHDAEGISG